MKNRRLFFLFASFALVLLIIAGGYFYYSPKIISQPLPDPDEKTVFLIEDEPFPYQPEVRFGIPVTWHLTIPLTTSGCQLQVSIDPDTGKILWNDMCEGIWLVTVTASNWAGKDSQTFSVKHIIRPFIKINLPSAITAQQDFKESLDISGSQPIKLSCSNPDIKIEDADNFKPQSSFYWEKPKAGKYSVRFTASNPAGKYSRDWNVTVKGEPVKITSEPQKTTMAGMDYEYQVKAAGSPEFRWQLEDAPEGMSIGKKGVVLLPADFAREGNYNVEIKASNIVDGKTCTDTQTFTLQCKKMEEKKVEKQKEQSKKLTNVFIKRIFKKDVIDAQKEAIKKAEEARKLALQLKEQKAEAERQRIEAERLKEILRQQEKAEQREAERQEALRKEQEMRKKQEEEHEKHLKAQRKVEEEAKKKEEELERQRENQRRALEAEEKAKREGAARLEAQRRKQEALRKQEAYLEEQQKLREAEEAERIAKRQRKIEEELRKQRMTENVPVPTIGYVTREEIEKGKKIDLSYDFVMTGWSFADFNKLAKSREFKILFIPEYKSIQPENYEVTGLDSNGNPVVEMRGWDDNHYPGKGCIVAEIPTEGKDLWKDYDTNLRKKLRAGSHAMTLFFPYHFFTYLEDAAISYYDVHKINPAIPFKQGAGKIKFTITMDYKFKILSMGNTR